MKVGDLVIFIGFDSSFTKNNDLEIVIHRELNKIQTKCFRTNKDLDFWDIERFRYPTEDEIALAIAQKLSG